MRNKASAHHHNNDPNSHSHQNILILLDLQYVCVEQLTSYTPLT